MATLLQYPDALSLSGNLKKIIISSSVKVRFALYKGGTNLVDEDYLPDSSGKINIDIRDIVTSSLIINMPTSDVYTQTRIADNFTIYLDGSATAAASFRALRCGVERFADTASNFLTANFLTWQPQVKQVTADQPEWLTYYFTEESDISAEFYNIDGTTKKIIVGSGAAGECKSFNVQFSSMWARGATIINNIEKERHGYFDVFIENSQGTKLSYTQRYIYRGAEALDNVYLCKNSLGGIDTFLLCGERKFVPELEHTLAEYDEKTISADIDGKRRWSQNTGVMGNNIAVWAWELLHSKEAYFLLDGTIAAIALDSSSIEESNIDNIKNYTFEYRMSEDRGLLKIRRTSSLPTNLEVVSPDSELFFLEPRLVDFPEATLEDTLLLIAQSPYFESWKKLSFGALKSAIYDYLLTSTVGVAAHTHLNNSILDLLSVNSDGELCYNGPALAESGEIAEHNHDKRYYTKEEDNHHLSSKLDLNVFSDLFQKINIGTSENPLYAIKAKYTFISTGDIIAFQDTSSGASGASGALSELTDVALSNPVSGQALLYNGTHWVNSTVNIGVSSVLGLTGAIVKSDLQSQIVDSAHRFVTDTQINDWNSKEVNVQSNWNTTDVNSDAYILNKPTSMPASDVQEWAKASSKPSYSWSEINNKPATFAPSAHNHDDRYYTESEINSIVSNSELSSSEAVASIDGRLKSIEDWRENPVAESILTSELKVEDSINVGGVKITIDEFGNILIDGTICATGDIIAFQDTSSGASGASGALSELTDVALSNPVSGQALLYNGTHWVNSTVNIGVSSVLGLTGAIVKSDLQSQIVDSAHRFVTDTQINDWNSKEVNVQSNWNTTDVNSDAYILNKPTSMPASDVQEWAKASSKPSYSWSEINNKPATFAPSAHNHDDRYYTESEINSIVSNSELSSSEAVASIDGRLKSIEDWRENPVAESILTSELKVEDSINVGGVKITIDEFGNILIDGTICATGDIIAFQDTSSGASGASGALSELTDVALSNPVSGQALLYNGTHWVNSTVNIGVSSVLGLTGAIVKSDLQSQIVDSAHRFVTDTQINDWNSKEVNVQSNWNTTDVNSDAYILNKPTSMPASDVQEWAKASSKPSYSWSEINNKPATFAPSAHNHDDRYYTESEINSIVSNSELSSSEAVASIDGRLKSLEDWRENPNLDSLMVQILSIVSTLNLGGVIIKLDNNNNVRIDGTLCTSGDIIAFNN